MRRLSAIVLATALGAAQVLPQDTVTFRATAQFVVVNVSARDKTGNPVPGLTSGDFRILEDGTPQKIVLCEYQELSDSPLPQPRPHSRSQHPDAAPGRVTTPASSPGEVRYKDRRLLVMFFDQSSMAPAELWRAQTAALEFLRERMTASDVVAVMSYTKQLEILQRFTSDRDALIRAVSSLSAAADREDGDEFRIFNTDRKLAALEDAVRMLGSLPERKALVYFASGSGTTLGAENRSQLRATINAAQRSNVVFYSVDAKGLVAAAPMGNAATASPGGSGIYSGEAAWQTATRLGGGDETLYRLAAETGGKTWVDTNDLSLGLRGAQKEFSSYYILGYYSANPAEDGKYRRIRVEVKRGLALTLDHRKGYFAHKQFKDFNAADRERQLEEALELQDPMTDLPMAVEVNYFRLERNRYYVPVAVKLPGGEIPLPGKDGGGRVRLDFIGEVRRERGPVSAVVRDSVEFKLSGDTATQLPSRPVQYQTGFRLPPGTYTLKLLARENQTGKIGTFETTFAVPDMSAETRYLGVSSVVLSNSKYKLGAPAGGPEPAHHPLSRQVEKLVPSVTRVFRPDPQLNVYLEVYPAAADAGPVTVSVAFFRESARVFESEPQRVSSAVSAASKAVPVRVTVPLQSLAPGKYTCQVSVLAPAIHKFAFRRIPIYITARARPSDLPAGRRVPSGRKVSAVAAFTVPSQ